MDKDAKWMITCQIITVILVCAVYTMLLNHNITSRCNEIGYAINRIESKVDSINTIVNKIEEEIEANY